MVEEGNVTYVDMTKIGAVESCDLFWIILDNLKQPIGDCVLRRLRRVQEVFEAELNATREIEKSYHVILRLLTWRALYQSLSLVH